MNGHARERMPWEWHKLLALAMHKLGVREITITVEDVESLIHAGSLDGPLAIVASDLDERTLLLRLMPEAYAYEADLPGRARRFSRPRRRGGPQQ